MQVIHICVCSSSSSSVCVVIWDLGGGGGGGWSLGKVTEQHTAVKTLSRNQKKLFLSSLIFFFVSSLFKGWTLWMSHTTAWSIQGTTYLCLFKDEAGGFHIRLSHFFPSSSFLLRVKIHHRLPANDPTRLKSRNSLVLPWCDMIPSLK